MDDVKELFSGKSFVSSVLLFLLVASAGSAAYFYVRFAEVRQNPQKIAQEETERLLARVGALIVLPEGEVPTVATVSDVEKLKNQPFFANAKNGDKVLIYANAKKAILFNPVAQKIVEVAPVNIGNSPATGAPSE